MDERILASLAAEQTEAGLCRDECFITAIQLGTRMLAQRRTKLTNTDTETETGGIGSFFLCAFRRLPSDIGSIHEDKTIIRAPSLWDTMLHGANRA